MSDNNTPPPAKPSTKDLILRGRELLAKSQKKDAEIVKQSEFSEAVAEGTDDLDLDGLLSSATMKEMTDADRSTFSKYLKHHAEACYRVPSLRCQMSKCFP